ncbi:MAG: hypothetical protein ACK58L_22055 [Planctomycetota bacterium]
MGPSVIQHGLRHESPPGTNRPPGGIPEAVIAILVAGDESYVGTDGQRRMMHIGPQVGDYESACMDAK